MKKSALVALVALALLAAAGIVLSQTSESLSLREVYVTNFPKTQEVKGSVTVPEVIPHSRIERREGIIVPPSRRGDITEMVSGGTLEAEGFSAVSVCFQGEMKSSLFESGIVGALLVPAEEPVHRALRDGRRLQFPIEAALRVNTGDSPFFNAEQAVKDLGFTRYQIYFYNTTNKGIEANLYLLLTH